MLTPRLSPSEEAFAAASQDVYLQAHSTGESLQRWGETFEALTQWLEKQEQQHWEQREQQQHHHHQKQQQQQQRELQDLMSKLLSLLGAAEARSLLEKMSRVGAPVLRPAVMLLSLLRLLRLEDAKEMETSRVAAAASLHMPPLITRATQKSLNKALPQAVGTYSVTRKTHLQGTHN